LYGNLKLLAFCHYPYNNQVKRSTTEPQPRFKLEA